MKTRKTTFIAVLSQTLTTTSTFTRTSRVYSQDGQSDFDLKDGEGNALATTAAPIGGSGQRWCVQCATPMAMMSPELAATVCFQTIRAIYRLVEAGRIHFTDGPEGVMVCTASLMKDWAGEQGIGLLTRVPARLSGCEIKRT